MNWLKLKYEPGFREQVHGKISNLQLVENEIPGVIIIHDIIDSSVVYMSQAGLAILGVSLEELRSMGPAYFYRYFNPEEARNYVPQIIDLLKRNNDNEVVSYFQQVRPSEAQEWAWYSSSTKIFLRDDQHKPVLTITIAIPVDPQHHLIPKVEKLLNENSFLHQHQHMFASLTKREKQILRLMALSINSNEIAERLHISESTANTHRRNIRRKIHAQTNYDVIKFAQAFDLI